MNNKDWTLWNNITFKTLGYRKNFDLVNDNENIITEYEGSILETRIAEKKPSILIGEFSFSVWNIDLSTILNIDLNKLIKNHVAENIYAELYNMIIKKEFDINSFKKIVFIHTTILHKDYRKQGIVEELIEMFYRDFYDKNTAIIALVKPFQNNPIDTDFYYKRKFILSKENISVPAFEYYQLNELTEKIDIEINEYKLFAIINKCGFNRIDESHLFIYSPEKTIKRMFEKQVFIKTKNNLIDSFDK